MDDTQIAAEINRLVETEHRLERAHVGVGLSDAEAQQLRSLEVQLDQCWDLLRQRRARREFGENPSEAIARPVGEVEGYMQ